MGKYGKGYEPWTIKAGESNLTIRPRKGDVSEFLNIAKGVKEGNTDLYNLFGLFIEKMIKRDHPPLNDEEENELQEFVEANIVKLSEELPVALKITTREELEKVKTEEGMLKKKTN
jgi:hypothetical protein